MPSPYRPQKRSSKKRSNAYKTGKLIGGSRFNNRQIDKKWLIVGACVLFTFVFAVVLGNILGGIAANSQNNSGGIGSAGNPDVPSVDRVSPKLKLHGYVADMKTAIPDVSLSEQTGVARQSGNAICIQLRDGSGTLIYSSDKATELGYSYRDNLTLARLNNHFDYYNDYAVGIFTSDLSPSSGIEKRLTVTKNEALLLAEATESAFEQIIIEFSTGITKENAIYFQAYLLEIKLACKGIPIGIKFSEAFISSSENVGLASELLRTADFYAVDLGNKNAAEISAMLDSLSYYGKRYNGVIIISGADAESLAERIKTLEDKGFDSYIIK